MSEFVDCAVKQMRIMLYKPYCKSNDYAMLDGKPHPQSQQEVWFRFLPLLPWFPVSSAQSKAAFTAWLTSLSISGDICA